MNPLLLPLLLTLAVTSMLLIGAGPLAAKLGGWNKLAEAYAAQEPFTGSKILASGGMGIANYGFSLLLGADVRGLSLETTGVVRAGHKPLFIPWADIKAREARAFFTTAVYIEFPKAPGIILRLTRRSVRRLREISSLPEVFPEIS